MYKCTSTCLVALGPGARAPGRAGTRRNVRTPSWHVRKVLGAKPYFSGSATRPLRHLAAACVAVAASKGRRRRRLLVRGRGLTGGLLWVRRAR
jgi:hypothetical protein